MFFAIGRARNVQPQQKVNDNLRLELEHSEVRQNINSGMQGRGNMSLNCTCQRFHTSAKDDNPKGLD